MPISRALMGHQLKGNKMKCRPVKKKAIGGVLGALASGDLEGAIPGVIPRMLMDRRKRKKDEARAKASGEGPSSLGGPTGVTEMKAGGKVTRGDGVCVKGHTKGKMR